MLMIVLKVLRRQSPWCQNESQHNRAAASTKRYTWSLQMTNRCCMYCQLVKLVLTTTSIPLFLSNRNRGHVSRKTPSAYRRNHTLRKKSDVEQRSTTIRGQDQTTGHIIKQLSGLKNPLSASMDDQFLRFEVLLLRGIALQMQRARQQLVTVEGAVGGYWRGCIPNLRVIMTLTLDNVKSLLLARGNCLTRVQLDARNSDIR